MAQEGGNKDRTDDLSVTKREPLPTELSWRVFADVRFRVYIVVIESAFKLPPSRRPRATTVSSADSPYFVMRASGLVGQGTSFGQKVWGSIPCEGFLEWKIRVIVCEVL